MFPILESDVPPNEHLRNLHVTFYPGMRPNSFRSRETGKPEFDNVDFIRKVAGGNPNNVIERPVTDQDKREFPHHWAAYQNNQHHVPLSGTALEDWPRLDAATRAKLKALEFHTVEQLAEASDAQIASIGMGCYELQTRARAFIAAAKDSALAQKQAEELTEKQQRIDDLENTLKQALARIDDLEKAKVAEPKPAGRGRGAAPSSGDGA